MSNIRILDCTLRDGGYINDWDFGKKCINNIIVKLGDANIDIIECGFLKSGNFDGNKTLFSNIQQINRCLDKKRRELMYVAMIAYGDINIEEISECGENTIDGIRLTFHEDEIEEAVFFGEQIKNKGYYVFMQPVGTSHYTDINLIKLVHKVNELEPFAFYLVDTLGIMYKNDLLRIFYLVNNNLNEDIAIGFHSHNNLQLSFSNAQELIAIYTKRQIIIDSSVFGMGRGAGNLPTELVTRYINDNIEARYNIIPILEIVDDYLSLIFATNPWGYSAPYYIAAINQCHPNFAGYLVNKQTISVSAINMILNMIPMKKRHIFDEKLIEKLYLDYQIQWVDETSAISELTTKIPFGRPILVMAPGRTIETEGSAVDKFVKESHPFVVSVNFKPKQVKADLLFLSNTKRSKNIENINKYSKDMTVVATSNTLQTDFFVVNYADLIDTSSVEVDNAGVMCLKLLYKLGIKKVFLAGFDGFSADNTRNYVDTEMINNLDKKNQVAKTESIKTQLIQLQNNMEINFITTSAYEKERNETSNNF